MNAELAAASAGSPWHPRDSEEKGGLRWRVLSSIPPHSVQVWEHRFQWVPALWKATAALQTLLSQGLAQAPLLIVTLCQQVERNVPSLLCVPLSSY